MFVFIVSCRFELTDTQLVYKKAPDTTEVQGAIVIKHIKDVCNDEDILVSHDIVLSSTIFDSAMDHCRLFAL
jgi:hypothetical protein